VTRDELAAEIAERNNRCGDLLDEQICLRPRSHTGAHEYEPTRKVIPIQ
jgi:hypothetical protein